MPGSLLAIAQKAETWIYLYAFVFSVFIPSTLSPFLQEIHEAPCGRWATYFVVANLQNYTNS